MLENPRSPHVRAVAKLAKRKARSSTGLFLVEGPQAVGEALTFRPELVTEFYATRAASERYPGLMSSAADAGARVELVSDQVLEAMATTVTPQGIVAVCRQFPTSVTDVFAARPRLVAVLEQVRDPGNAGAIIRTADSAGADAVVLTTASVDLYNPKVVRSTSGSLFHVPIAVEVDLPSALDAARRAGLRILAADVTGSDLLDARQAGRLAAPTAWLFGNEAHGLDDAELAACDEVLALPVYGKAESMNLATAAAVCLYESAFAHRG